MITPNEKCNNLVILAGEVTSVYRSNFSGQKYLLCINLKVIYGSEYQVFFEHEVDEDLVCKRIRLKGKIVTDSHGDIMIKADGYVYILKDGREKVVA